MTTANKIVRIFHVYMIKNRMNGKCYIGKTSRGIDYRVEQHRAANSESMSLHRAIRKYGWVNFEVILLYEGVDDREISFVERAMIAQYNTYGKNGYNQTVGGDGTSGWKPSDETRQRMSEAAKIKIFTEDHRRKIGESARGHTLSEEVRRSLSANATRWQTGRKLSDEHKKNVGLAHLGKKRRPETGAAISAALKGKPKSPEHREKLRLATIAFNERKASMQ